jgi:4-amino-4-deoxy-L-arabinose transferase-like glycosyltransferase
MDRVNFLAQYLPLLIPLFLLELGLIIFALVDLFRRENTRGPKWVWVLVILFVSTIGPIIYFVLGRKEE